MEQLKRKLSFGDIVVLVLVAALVVTVFVCQVFGRKAGSVCTLRTEDNTYEFDLSEDTRLEVTSCGISLTVVVENGEAFVEESGCPDKVCVRSGKASHAGETVVCVPAKVSLTIGTEADGDADWILG